MCMAKVGAVHKAKTQMLSTEYFALLKILYVNRQRLGDLTEEEARKERYSSRSEYFEAFAEINKIPLGKLDFDMMVWVVGLEVVNGS